MYRLITHACRHTLSRAVSRAFSYRNVTKTWTIYSLIAFPALVALDHAQLVIPATILAIGYAASGITLCWWMYRQHRRTRGGARSQ